MRSKDTILIVLFIVIFSSLNLYSQSKNFECGFTPSSNLYGVKPTRTNFSSDPYEACLLYTSPSPRD